MVSVGAIPGAALRWAEAGAIMFSVLSHVRGTRAIRRRTMLLSPLRQQGLARLREERAE